MLDEPTACTCLVWCLGIAANVHAVLRHEVDTRGSKGQTMSKKLAMQAYEAASTSLFV